MPVLGLGPWGLCGVKIKTLGGRCRDGRGCTGRGSWGRGKSWRRLPNFFRDLKSFEFTIARILDKVQLTTSDTSFILFWNCLDEAQLTTADTSFVLFWDSLGHRFQMWVCIGTVRTALANAGHRACPGMSDQQVWWVTSISFPISSGYEPSSPRGWRAGGVLCHFDISISAV